MGDSLWVDISEAVIALALGYSIIGLCFAALFVAHGVTVVDHAAQGSRWTFRLMILPGTVALWPWLAKRWLRANRARAAERRA